MPDKEAITKDYLTKETSKEVKVRAAKLGITKIKLFDLLARIPFKDLTVLVEKYLTKKHPPAN